MRASDSIKTISVLCVLLAGFAQAERGVYNSFSSGELGRDIYGRTDALKFYSGARIVENMFVWPHGPVEKRRGTYYVSEILAGTTTGGSPGSAGTYTTTYMSENGIIWGVPTGDGVMGVVLSGVVSDLGGGLVSLPTANNPYTLGMVIFIEGTTFYDELHTLVSGTSSTALVFADNYQGESFDGTETFVRKIASLPASSGRMAADTGVNNMYYGHNWDLANSTYITRIETDGTQHKDAVTFSTVPNGGTCFGVKLSADEGDLYVLSEIGLWKFDLSDGSETWFNTDAYKNDLDIDASDRAYAPVTISGESNISQFASADGIETVLTLMGSVASGTTLFSSFVFDVHVDDALGLVMFGGVQAAPIANDETKLYNFAVRTFDNSAGDQAQPGGTFEDLGIADKTFAIGSNRIASNGENIYILIPNTIYKYSWDGQNLNLEESVATETGKSGIYCDLYGNIVVTKTDVPDTDLIWFYDTDLNFLSKIDNMNIGFLRTWNAAISTSVQRGNVAFDGTLAVAGTPFVDLPGSDTAGEEIPVRLLSFSAEVGDGRIVEMGEQYFAFYKDGP